jgi:hypothetical protein
MSHLPWAPRLNGNPRPGNFCATEAGSSERPAIFLQPCAILRCSIFPRLAARHPAGKHLCKTYTSLKSVLRASKSAGFSPGGLPVLTVRCQRAGKKS